MPVSLQMDKDMKRCLNWILMVSMSPIAILVVILLALVSLLRFFYKTSLLFIIVAINTPFAVMYNVSILVVEYYGPHFRKTIARFQKSNACFGESRASIGKPSASHWNSSDPRASVGIEITTIVSDFFKVIAGELLLVISAGIITYYTAPRLVFYISTAISLVALSHKWLNTECLSKTALSCLFGGYGLNPLMFLFSYIGLFNIGCHPVAKCSFAASRAFLFVKNVPIPLDEMTQIAHPKKMVKVIDDEEVGDEMNQIVHPTIAHAIITHPKIACPRIAHPKIAHPKIAHVKFIDDEEAGDEMNRIAHPQKMVKDIDIEEAGDEMNRIAHPQKMVKVIDNEEAGNHPFNGVLPIPNWQGDQGDQLFIFFEWNAFERGLFQLCPKIEIINRNHTEKYVLKSFMVLKLLNKVICKYLVEQLELPEDFSKANELYNFLVTLSSENGFVTDKMRGRYEHSLTLLQIAEGVQENAGYNIVDTKEEVFVVAGCTN